MELSDAAMKKMKKCAAQFSTAFRTLSGVFGLMGTKCHESPQTDSLEPGEIGNSCSDSESDDVEPDIRAWLFTPSCRWGVYHSKDVAVFIINGKYRGDRYKNYWKLTGNDPNNKRHWKKVNEDTIRSVYIEYNTMVHECTAIIREEKTKDSELWNSIHRRKQLRLFNVSEAEQSILSWTAFNGVLKDQHNDLPALRSL